MTPLFAHMGILRRKPKGYWETLEKLEREVREGRVQEHADSGESGVQAATSSRTCAHTNGLPRPSLSPLSASEPRHWWTAGAFE